MRVDAVWPALREYALRLWGTVRGRRASDDIQRELDTHLAMAEEALRRRGHSPAEAARLARLRFGGSDQALDSVRAQRGFPPLDYFALDLKLGLRMLRKHLALTLIGGLTMAGSMTFGAAAYHLWHVATQDTVPLEEGERLVVLQPWDPVTGTGLRTSVLDFERWRAALRSVEDVGAFRPVQRNLIAENVAPVGVQVAEMSAAGFRVARVPPLLGRALLEQDESASADPVVVIGYGAWQSRFGGDRDVLGRIVQLDGVDHTVVGVMPAGFRFPVAFQYWTKPTQGASDRVVVFARLASGVTPESAAAEIQVVGLDDPTPPMQTGEPLRARIVPFVTGIIGAQGLGVMLLVPLLLPLVLLPPCVNIGILVYARTLARQGEFAARAALGATRSRIVAQVFIEMLVLALVAAALAAALAPKLVDWIIAQTVFGDVPFWMDFAFSYDVIGYAAALAIVAALIAGAIPALRATGRGQLAGLHALGARAVPRLGRAWTALVVAQVALAAATLPVVAELAWAISGPAVAASPFAPEEYLVARPRLDAVNAPASRFASLIEELARRLEAEAGVTAVTFAEALPSGEQQVRIEVESGGSETASRIATAMFNRVDADFFAAFRTRLLMGRGFTAADFGPGESSILVNQTFARRIFGDANPLGRRIRMLGAEDAGGTSAAEPWLEVVGVVEDFSAKGGRRTFYRPLSLDTGAGPATETGAGVPAQLALAIRAAPTVLPELDERLRELVATLDPDLRLDGMTMRVDRITTLDIVYETYWIQDETLASSLAGVMLGLLVLSGAGVYTLMAFAVVQRRREIGIRAALGARPWMLIAGIFRRVLLPVSVAACVGALAATFLDYYYSPLLFDLREGGRPLPWVLPAAEAFILGLGLLVVAGPARRALRIDPVETLRDE